MNKQTFKAGDTVYSAYGVVGKYVAAIAEGHVVQPAMEDYDGEQYYAGVEVWPEAFQTLPVVKLHEEVAALEKQAQELRTNIRALRQSQIDLERDARNRMAAIASHEQLKHLEEFLAGRVTHYVVVDLYGYKITPLQEAKCEGDDGYLKLLTLFGNSKGDLQWRLNKYKDGSGFDYEAYPCASEEQAKEIAYKMISGVFDEWRVKKTNEHHLFKAIESAQKLGFEVPADLLAVLRNRRMESLQKRLADVKTQEADILIKIAEQEAAQ